jgi:hypothetical protein
MPDPRLAFHVASYFPSELCLRAMAAAKTARRSSPKKSAKKAPKRASKKRATLSRKQLNQRKYAGRMSGIRKRASKATGGKGLVKRRVAATKLRQKLGLKSA